MTYEPLSIEWRRGTSGHYLLAIGTDELVRWQIDVDQIHTLMLFSSHAVFSPKHVSPAPSTDPEAYGRLIVARDVGFGIRIPCQDRLIDALEEIHEYPGHVGVGRD